MSKFSIGLFLIAIGTAGAVISTIYTLSHHVTSVAVAPASVGSGSGSGSGSATLKSELEHVKATADKIADEAAPKNLGHRYEKLMESYGSLPKSECEEWDTNSVICKANDKVAVYCVSPADRAPSCQVVIDTRPPPAAPPAPVAEPKKK